MDNHAVKEWEGKVILVYLKRVASSAPPAVSILNPSLQDRHGRKFLIGTVPQHEKDWASGLAVEVAWEEVAHLVVFDSLSNYQTRLLEAPVFWEPENSGDESN